MEQGKAVLVLETTEYGYRLFTEHIADDSIPKTLNGESGFHVYHVRVLTELILKQYREAVQECTLSDADIEAISIASSLHDIGKSEIPKSILDFPGKLSPLEYDIVKKHAAFGEEMIGRADFDGDAEIIRHAKEIARNHHERVDGTGYPDGLRGKDIPLSAQAVALADSFDALTSSRSYKQAFSQDVAIQMISNGMCGVFDNVLTDCLMQVVNDKMLIDIRERLKKERRVVQDYTIFTPKHILFIGNTSFVTDHFLAETFPESKITVVGESDVTQSLRVKAFKTDNPHIPSLFETYDFDVVIYFARELSYGAKTKSDAEELKTVLEYTASTQKNAKFIYLSSLDSAFSERSDRTVLTTAKESLCDWYFKEKNLDIKVVRIPYLYSSVHKKDFLNKIFTALYTDKTVILPESQGASCFFLSEWDLSELLNRLVDGWSPGNGALTVADEFKLTFSDFADALRKIKPEAKIDFTGENKGKTLAINNKALRNEYGWFSRISVALDMEEQWQRYLEMVGHKELNWWQKIVEWFKKATPIVKVTELFLLFIITELLIWLTDSAVLFSIVDFRMAFIVIMATMHGLSMGMSAAALSSVSWLIAKLIGGTNILTIFYEPSNWLAFIFFFLIGGLCGYIRIKNDDTISNLESENGLLEEKLLFTRELYNDTFNEKRDLKKQIIGSKDSFGKIFDVIRHLDTVESRELYLKIMDTFEDILENKSISVYSVTENSAFGRLEVASRDVIAEVSRSISLDAFKPVIDKLEKGESYRNTELAQGLPMYASGVTNNGKLTLLIFLWHAAPDQRSLYYVNLFKIMCDLAQISLLRAYEYNLTVQDAQYIENTHIMGKDAFEKTYQSFKRMAERKVFTYVLLGVDGKGKSLKELDEMLHSKVRVNDILGIDEAGEVKILLSQASKKDLEFVLPRFADLDVEISVLE